MYIYLATVAFVTTIVQGILNYVKWLSAALICINMF